MGRDKDMDRDRDRDMDRDGDRDRDRDGDRDPLLGAADESSKFSLKTISH